MQLPYRGKRDVYAGLLMVLLGAFAAYIGSQYPLGEVSNMGPGFVPTSLGIILAGLGVLIALVALVSDKPEEHATWQLPDRRGSLCIIGGLVAFVVLAKYLGLAPASFALVFISAMGDTEQTWKGAALLAIVVTACGIGVFSYLLQLPFPLFIWKG
ncbi:MAG TPA: tripartite tricarboxylate transporter TctB family protein [Bauldia sp.]|nr:tripartite tricarboxylate transporter TctB family protein [Bauldia sp.]